MVFSCPDCNKPFMTEHSLTRHILRESKKVDPSKKCHNKKQRINADNANYNEVASPMTDVAAMIKYVDKKFKKLEADMEQQTNILRELSGIQKVNMWRTCSDDQLRLPRLGKPLW